MTVGREHNAWLGTLLDHASMRLELLRYGNYCTSCINISILNFLVDTKMLECNVVLDGREWI